MRVMSDGVGRAANFINDMNITYDALFEDKGHLAFGATNAHWASGTQDAPAGQAAPIRVLTNWIWTQAGTHSRSESRVL